MDNLNSFKAKQEHAKDNKTLKEPRSEKSRKLTVENTSNNSNPNIDKQISELESLIKKLQDEIVEMSNNSDDLARNYTEHYDIHQEGNEDTSLHDVHILTSKYSDLNHTSIRCGEKDINLDSAVISKVTPSQVYPITIKDIGLNLINQSKNFADQVSNLINHNCDDLNTADTFSDIRRQFSILWDDAEKPSSSNGNYDNMVKNEEDKKND
ncbi:hypothetical protein K1T71_013236 [Dendrolimus kikuchii]|uniref:Uncharacterized protein n=1 Tax=Dendrolimus kikuchii TaxID=765133 RepID=A0ACC1CHW9_9NEOP|nr:hypothetical protein K1T71_013236 [Dendrolimus kikuchii]